MGNQIKVCFVAIVLISLVFARPEEPTKCKDPRQEYRRCQSSSCIKTCENPNPGPVCTLDCQSGCFCKEPYVLDRSNGQCVEIPKCKKLCRENEVYKTCGPCDSTCNGDVYKCTRNCVAKCYCKDGYVRFEGRCVRISQCPRTA